MLDTKYSVITMVVYIFVGLVGLPVFAGFQAGAGAIAGPYGGYMIGFIPECLISGILLKKKKNRSLTFLSLVAGLIFCYGLGASWFLQYAHCESLGVVMVTCVYPFIIPDVIKAWLAIILSERLKKAISKQI